MSVEKAKECLLSLKEKAPDEAFIERLKSVKTEEELLQVYVEFAGPMGYDLSVEDVKEAASELEAERRAKTLAVEQELKALDDDELENVAGGDGSDDDEKYDDICYVDFEDTNCAVFDACDSFFVSYGD